MFDKIPELKERIGEQDSAEEAEEEEAKRKTKRRREDEDEDDKAEKEEDGEDGGEEDSQTFGDIDADLTARKAQTKTLTPWARRNFQSAEEEAPSATPRDQKGVAPSHKEDVFGLECMVSSTLTSEFNRQSLALENGNEDENGDDGG